MPAIDSTTAILAGLCVLFLLLMIRYKRQADALTDNLDKERSRQRSRSTPYGRINGQWFPLMDAYPYNPRSFRLLREQAFVRQRAIVLGDGLAACCCAFWRRSRGRWLIS